MGNRQTGTEPGPEVIHPEMQEEGCPWGLPALEGPDLELWKWSSKDAGEVAVVCTCALALCSPSAMQSSRSVPIHQRLNGFLIPLLGALKIEGNGIEWNRIFQLEGTYNGHLVQLPDHFRAYQKLKHVIKCFVQMPL